MMVANKSDTSCSHLVIRILFRSYLGMLLLVYFHVVDDQNWHIAVLTGQSRPDRVLSRPGRLSAIVAGLAGQVGQADLNSS